MNRVTAFSAVLILLVFWSYHGRSASNQATANSGPNVKRDGSKESTGTDEYGASYKKSKKFAQIKCIVKEPDGYDFRAFNKNEIVEGKGFNTKWLDAIISAQIGKRDVQDGATQTTVGLLVKVPTNLNAAQFTAYIEGNLSPSGKGSGTPGDGNEHNWGGMVSVPLEMHKPIDVENNRRSLFVFQGTKENDIPFVLSSELDNLTINLTLDNIGSAPNWDNGGTARNNGHGRYFEKAKFGKKLPEKNSDFGKKSFTVSRDVHGLSPDEMYVKIFFNGKELYHQDPKSLLGTKKMANWFYYWRQFINNMDSTYYGGMSPGTKGFYEEATKRVILYDTASGVRISSWVNWYDPDERETHKSHWIAGNATDEGRYVKSQRPEPASGIDCCVKVLAHEMKHAEISQGSFGKTDTDGDLVCDEIEIALGWTDHRVKDSWGMVAVFSEYKDFGDYEYMAHRAEEGASANDEYHKKDWSSTLFERAKGKQWPGASSEPLEEDDE